MTKEKDEKCFCGKKWTQINLEFPSWEIRVFCDICYIEYLKKHNSMMAGQLQAKDTIIDKLLCKLS